MRFQQFLAVVVWVVSSISPTQAAVTAEEAARLDTTLTAVGAEKAANRDGSIPAYAGGLTTPPVGFKEGGSRIDPFAGDSPVLVIDGNGMAAHADRLTEGSKALLQKYPGYRMDIYPTRRSAAFPSFVTQNTVKCATTAKTADDGRSMAGCRAGFPFPIPGSGIEAMWNHLVRFGGVTSEVEYSNWYIDPAGNPAMTSKGLMIEELTYWNTASTDTEAMFRRRIEYTGPARKAGEALLVIEPLNFADRNRRAWQYLPGTRRIKTAPDLTFDTPNAAAAGRSTFDDTNVFSGSMERYTFKLVGKKEMYIPYNTYRLAYEAKPEELLKPDHLNPDLVRWELHRIWIVEATLREGMRHVYARRVFYLDEDSWVAVASDQYNGQGRLFRSSFAFVAPSYEVPAPVAYPYAIYDFIAGGYFLGGRAVNAGSVRYVAPRPEREWTSDSLLGSGLR